MPCNTTSTPIYKAGADGTGITIGIVSQAGIDNTVVANYRTLFGLPSNLPVEIVDGMDPGTDGDGAGVEADLDVEVSGSVAPRANIYLYTGYDTSASYGLFSAATRVVEDNTADVISVSYGICEPTLGLAGNLLFSQLWSQASRARAIGLRLFRRQRSRRLRQLCGFGHARPRSKRHQFHSL